MAFAGVALVTVRSGGSVSAVGVVLGVAAAVCWAFGTVTAKRVAPRVEPLWAVALPLVAGGLVLSAIAGATGATTVDLSGRVLVAVAWTTLVGTTVAWLLWMYLVSGGDVGRVAVSILSYRSSPSSWAGPCSESRSAGGSPPGRP